VSELSNMTEMRIQRDEARAECERLDRVSKRLLGQLDDERAECERLLKENDALGAMLKSINDDELTAAKLVEVQHATIARLRGALKTIRDDHAAHAELAGKDWYAALCWSQGIARKALCDAAGGGR